jgi:hypothetical protein
MFRKSTRMDLRLKLDRLLYLVDKNQFEWKSSDRRKALPIDLHCKICNSSIKVYSYKSIEIHTDCKKHKTNLKSMNIKQSTGTMNNNNNTNENDDDDDDDVDIIIDDENDDENAKLIQENELLKHNNNKLQNDLKLVSDKLKIAELKIEKYNEGKKINEFNDNIIKQTNNLNATYLAKTNALEELLLKQQQQYQENKKTTECNCHNKINDLTVENSKLKNYIDELLLKNNTDLEFYDDLLNKHELKWKELINFKIKNIDLNEQELFDYPLESKHDHKFELIEIQLNKIKQDIFNKFKQIRIQYNKLEIRNNNFKRNINKLYEEKISIKKEKNEILANRMMTRQSKHMTINQNSNPQDDTVPTICLD